VRGDYSSAAAQLTVNDFLQMRFLCDPTLGKRQHFRALGDSDLPHPDGDTLLDRFVKSLLVAKYECKVL
jgi:hypothetical protein